MTINSTSSETNKLISHVTLTYQQLTKHYSENIHANKLN